MTHPLEAYRDEIDALIGPLEEVEANFLNLIAELKQAKVPASDYSALFYLGITSTKDDLSTLVADIDGYEEPEPEPEEEDEPEEEEEEDEDEDDEEEEDI